MRGILFWLILSVVSLEAVSAGEIGRQDKIYISPDHVHILKEGIFVHVQDKWIQIPALLSDACGVYVVPSEAFVGAPWYCNNCNRWTTGWWVCEHCGSSKG